MRPSRQTYILSVAAVALAAAILLQAWATRFQPVAPAVSIDALVYPADILAGETYRSYIGLRATTSTLQLAVRACKQPGHCPFHYSQVVTLTGEEGAFRYWGWLANMRLPPGSYQADLFVRYPLHGGVYRTVKQISWQMTAE